MLSLLFVVVAFVAVAVAAVWVYRLPLEGPSYSLRKVCRPSTTSLVQTVLVLPVGLVGAMLYGATHKHVHEDH